MKSWILTTLFLAGCGSGAEAPQPVTAAPVIAVPAYESIPGSGSTVILLATTGYDTLHSVMGRIPSDLVSDGFSLISLDLPCHGPDADPVLAPLDCWRHRIEAGDTTIFTRFCTGLSAVLDKLNVKSASIVGLSRGGYVAATCAMRDSRIKSLALISPVTDLQNLREFSGYAVNESVFGLVPARLDNRNIFVKIGRTDDRVNTQAVVAFAQDVGAELVMLDTAGHDFMEDGSTAQWLVEN